MFVERVAALLAVPAGRVKLAARRTLQDLEHPILANGERISTGNGGGGVVGGGAVAQSERLRRQLDVRIVAPSVAEAEAARERLLVSAPMPIADHGATRLTHSGSRGRPRRLLTYPELWEHAPDPYAPRCHLEARCCSGSCGGDPELFGTATPYAPRHL